MQKCLVLLFTLMICVVFVACSNHSNQSQSIEKLEDSSIQDTEKDNLSIESHSSKLTFWVKPDEPADVIGKVAATIWLKSYMEDGIDLSERIENYTINEVTVTSSIPKDEQNSRTLSSQYAVQVNYDITTYSDQYVSSTNRVAGKGTFEGLNVELHVKSIGDGNFTIVSDHTRSIHVPYR